MSAENQVGWRPVEKPQARVLVTACCDSRVGSGPHPPTPAYARIHIEAVQRRTCLLAGTSRAPGVDATPVRAVCHAQAGSISWEQRMWIHAGVGCIAIPAVCRPCLVGGGTVLARDGRRGSFWLRNSRRRSPERGRRRGCTSGSGEVIERSEVWVRRGVIDSSPTLSAPMPPAESQRRTPVGCDGGSHRRRRRGSASSWESQTAVGVAIGFLIPFIN
jgi:hypothetical protein